MTSTILYTATSPAGVLADDNDNPAWLVTQDND